MRNGAFGILALGGLATLLAAGCVGTEGERAPPVAEALRASASDAAAQGDHAVAAEQFGKLVDRSPSDKGAALGYLENLRRIPGAEPEQSTLGGIRESLGGDPDVLVALAKFQIGVGKGREALADLDKARTLAPRNWEVYSLSGVAQDAQGNFQAAAAAYRAGLELSPGNPVILNNMALSLAQAGRLDEGIRILQDLLAGQVRVSPRIRQNLAMLHGFKGNIKEFEALARADLREEAVRKNMEAFRALQAGRGAPLP
jgi:Flp pilus assembly protein TadD